jgi:hypothetical protein
MRVSAEDGFGGVVISEREGRKALVAGAGDAVGQAQGLDGFHQDVIGLNVCSLELKGNIPATWNRMAGLGLVHRDG